MYDFYVRTTYYTCDKVLTRHIFSRFVTDLDYMSQQFSILDLSQLKVQREYIKSEQLMCFVMMLNFI